MIGLLQRVSQAGVVVDHQTIAAISQGLVVLVAVQRQDNAASTNRLLKRILAYRVFNDRQGRMNQSLQQVDGELLLVPQFTLAADTCRGNRPSFSGCAPPSQALDLFNYLCTQANQQYPATQWGQFGADMKLHLVNDGPVTFWL